VPAVTAASNYQALGPEPRRKIAIPNPLVLMMPCATQYAAPEGIAVFRALEIGLQR